MLPPYDYDALPAEHTERGPSHQRVAETAVQVGEGSINRSALYALRERGSPSVCLWMRTRRTQRRHARVLPQQHTTQARSVAGFERTTVINGWSTVRTATIIGGALGSARADAGEGGPTAARRLATSQDRTRPCRGVGTLEARRPGSCRVLDRCALGDKCAAGC